MAISASQILILAGSFSAVASLAHLVCIVIGAPAYRFMGAGEKMARAAEKGKWSPAVLTLGVAVVLAVWAVYAFSAAGVLPALPLTKLALVLISAVYLLRAFAFPLLKAAFPDNSQTFWWVSSGICLLVGSVHAYGTLLQWPQL